jgi:hypothetical protein
MQSGRVWAWDSPCMPTTTVEEEGLPAHTNKNLMSSMSSSSLTTSTDASSATGKSFSPSLPRSGLCPQTSAYDPRPHATCPCALCQLRRVSTACAATCPSQGDLKSKSEPVPPGQHVRGERRHCGAQALCLSIPISLLLSFSAKPSRLPVRYPKP